MIDDAPRTGGEEKEAAEIDSPSMAHRMIHVLDNSKKVHPLSDQLHTLPRTTGYMDDDVRKS
jgi:hypothetical protein